MKQITRYEANISTSDAGYRKRLICLGTDVAKLETENTALLGMFSDYDYACRHAEQARAIWEAMRGKMIKMEDMLRRSKQYHQQCDDNYYACPKTEDGCTNPEYEDGPCNCGADEWNKELEELLDA